MLPLFTAVLPHSKRVSANKDTGVTDVTEPPVIFFKGCHFLSGNVEAQKYSYNTHA